MKSYIILFNNILYVPSITRNLLFVSKFAKDHKVYFEFYANRCCVKSHTSNLVVHDGFLDDCGAYFFNKLSHNYHILLSNKSLKLYHFVNNIIVSTNTMNNANVWHYKLGHANFKIVHHILILCNISFNN